MSYSGVLRSRHDEGENPNSKDLGAWCLVKMDAKRNDRKRGAKKDRSGHGAWALPKPLALESRWTLTEIGQKPGGYFSCAFERISGEIPRGPLHDDPWRVTLQRQRVRLG